MGKKGIGAVTSHIDYWGCEVVDPIWTVLAKVKENLVPPKAVIFISMKQNMSFIPLSGEHQQAGANVKVCGEKTSRREVFSPATRRA